MATKYWLLPDPIWNSFDLTGRPAGGAQLFSYSELNYPVLKPIYQDSGGTLAYPNPIPFNLNGEAPGPFFFADDTPYYLVLTEAPIPGGPPIGNTIWQMHNFTQSIVGGGGSGGGGGTTTIIPVQNHIVNGVFNYNIGTVSPLVSTSTVLAPSAHDIGQPDIRFIKNAVTSTDAIVFQSFLPIGGNDLTPDITPEYYLQYNCTTDGGETQKSLQFPIDKHVQNLSGQTVTLSFWAKDLTSTGKTIKLFWYQYFGDGGAPSPSAPVQFVGTPLETLTGVWKQFTITETVPSVSGKTLGTVGNDALYLQFGFPTGTTCQIAFTKPEFYIGSIEPAADFTTYDEIDAITNSPRTGDIRTSINAFYPFGWVPMNDGTIGSLTSAATTRANVDTFELYNLIYTSVSDIYAPVIGGRTAPGNTFAAAVIDFAANKPITLTKSLGQVFAGTSPLIPAAQSYVAAFNVVNGGTLTVASTASLLTGTPVVLAGGTPPAGLVNGKVYYAINISATVIKLALTLASALAYPALNNAIAFTDNGTGPFTIQVNMNALGSYVGEELHTMTLAELVAHTHDAGTYHTDFATSPLGPFLLPQTTALGSGAISVPLLGTSGSTGGSTPFNVMQPTTYLNIFVKL